MVWAAASQFVLEVKPPRVDIDTSRISPGVPLAMFSALVP